jgi:hypothetical protein
LKGKKKNKIKTKTKNLKQKNMERKVKETFLSYRKNGVLDSTITSSNILDVEVTHNGYQSGDSGHSTFVSIKLRDQGSTAMDTVILFDHETNVNHLHQSGPEGEGFLIERPLSVTLTFKGTKKPTILL